MGLGIVDGCDVGSILILLSTLLSARRNFWWRGLTYRTAVLPLWQERVVKAIFFSSITHVIDTLLRRQIGVSTLKRVLFLWAPVFGWVSTGPMQYTTRDDSGFDARSQKYGVWKFLVTRVFKGTRTVLAEEWRRLSPEKVRQIQEQEQPFVMGLHPHGVMPMGAIINGMTAAGGGMQAVTASGATDVPKPASPGSLLHQQFFPNARLRAAVASGVFLAPGLSEVYRALGCVECTKTNLSKLLRDKKWVAIIPGGANEARFATGGRYVVYLKKRKGFIRLALEERVNVVPIYTFGEHDTVTQSRDPPVFLIKFQDFMKEITGLLIPLPSGLLRFGPLTSVCGTPVVLEDLWPAAVGDEVSQEAVDKAHARYMENLQRLFDENKSLVPGGHAEAVLEWL